MDRFQLPTPSEERARELPDDYTYEECAEMDAALEQAVIDLRVVAEDFAERMPEGFEPPEPTAPTHLPKSQRHFFLYDEADLVADIRRLAHLAELLKGRQR